MLCWLFLTFLFYAPAAQAALPDRQDKIGLEEAFLRLSKKYDAFFNYDRSIAHDIVVDYDEDQYHTLEEALSYLLKNTDLGYRIYDQRYVVVFQNSNAGIESLKNMIDHMQGLVKEKEIDQRRQDARSLALLQKLPPREVQSKRIVFTVSGNVTDEDGEALIGVNIQVKGSSKGTATDFDGQFSLEDIDENAILVISYVGYQTQEISVAGRSNLEIVMKSDSQMLDEVVVVGYGTLKERQVTGSIAKVSSRDLEGVSVSSVSDALIGKAPGVQVSKISGVPGSPPEIRIRGVGSITAGNSPLFVVDGFPMDDQALSEFDMNDIESINILKDASAAAIYGARGASGVIMITTKKGQEGPPKVSFDSYVGFQQLTKKVDMMSPEEYVEFATDAVNNAWERLGNDPNDPFEDRPSFYQVAPYYLDPNNWTYTDWQDEIYRTAPIVSSQISVSGGSKNINYRVSGSYFDEQGIIKTSDFTRYSLNASLNGNISQNVRFNFGVLASKVDRNKIPNAGQWNNGVVATALSLPGAFALRNEDGSYPSHAGMGYHVSAVRNPMVFLNEYNQKQRENRILANASVEWDIIDKLQFKSHFGINDRLNRHDEFTNSFINDIPSESTYSRGEVVNNGHFDATFSFEWLWENTLNYGFEINDAHTFNIVGGITAQKFTSQFSSINANEFPDNQVPTLNAGQVTSASTSRAEWAMLSYFSRINYDLLDKYFLSLSIRADGSSRFGSLNRWGYFPAISGGWIISDEEFLKNSTTLSFLKLKASFGMSGNNSISNYGSLGLLSYSNYALGGTNQSGVVPSSLSNANLAWEASKQTNAGVEIGLLKDRINLDFEVFQDISSNLLLNVPIPSILGFSSSLQNIGQVRNRGLEIAVTTRNFVREFEWTTNFDVSVVRNKVLSLGPSDKPIIVRSYGYATESNITEVGYPIGDFYGYIFEGIYNSVEEIESRPHLSDDTPGDPIVKDVNGDGEITTADRTHLGNYYPKFSYNIGNTFRYKGFDLSVFINGLYGNKIMNLGLFQTGSMTGRTNGMGFQRDRWRSPEEPGNGEIHKASIDVYGVRRNPSTFMISDASYLRIRNITLGYDVKHKFLKDKNIDKAKIYVSATNPFTFSSYYGYNPEVSSYNDPLTPGIDYFIYPLSKSLTFGLNLTF